MIKKLFLSIFIFSLLLLSACEVDDPVIVQSDDLTMTDLQLNYPSYFPSPVYDFNNNPITVDGFKLGRKLFYDPVLSKDSSTSCGTCHQQFAAFANLDHPTSHGINSLLGERNSPALMNLIWKDNLMWDGGVNNLEIQPFNPITNPVEMGDTLPNIILKLNRITEYKTMFQKAYGDDSITSQRIFRAITQFMGLMVSSNSAYDKYRSGEGTLTSNELNGLNLFRAKCASCHSEPLFTDNTFRSNGISVSPVYTDSGRATITFQSGDLYKFKVPSLRNIALSRPYMHDGRFETLSEVLDHYTSNISAASNTDTMLIGGIALSAQEKTDIISFLNTLTDFTFKSDSRFKEVQ